MTPFNTDDLAPETYPTVEEYIEETKAKFRIARIIWAILIALVIAAMCTSCQKHVEHPVKPTTTSAEVIKQSGVVTVTVTIPAPLTVRYYVHVKIYFGTHYHGAYLYLLPGQTTATWKAEFDFNPTSVEIVSEGEEKI